MKQNAAVSLNPATAEVIAEFPFQSEAELGDALAHAQSGFKAWAQSSVEARTALLSRMAAILRKHIDPLARTASREMGKPIAQARAEVEKCAVLCDWYAANGAPILKDEPTLVGE